MTHRITITNTADVFEVGSDDSLLEAAEAAGIALQHDCRFGGCGACRVKLLEGTVDYDEWPFGLTEEEAAQGYALACQAKATSDLTLSATVRPADYIAPDFHEATIARLERLSHDVMHLVLHIPSAVDVRFHPGQYLNVMMDDGTPRSFSMASPPQGEWFDLHVRRVPGGYFTEKLFREYRPGDRLDVELPLGEFRYHAEDAQPLLMVAGGTGLAPIKSLIEALEATPAAPPITLYWGVRTAQDLYLDETLRAWAAQRPDFTYIPVLSQAGDDWTGRRGFVHEAVCADHADLSGYDAYLCGPPPMIAGAKAAFTQQGMAIERMFADSFNFTHELEGTQSQPA